MIDPHAGRIPSCTVFHNFYLWSTRLHATLTASLIILVTTEAGRLRSSGFSAITVERGAQTQLQDDATT